MVRLAIRWPLGQRIQTMVLSTGMITCRFSDFDMATLLVTDVRHVVLALLRDARRAPVGSLIPPSCQFTMLMVPPIAR
jgi:hypothetical protein